MKKSPFITEADAIKEDFEGRTNYWMCRPEITNAKDLQVCRAVLPPGKGHDFHRHPENEEAIYVLEGEIEQWVGEQSQRIKKGECAHIPADVVHASFNRSDQDAVILAILSPGSQKGPLAVDMFEEEPWASIRQSKA
ncbi:cupin domain-containing protein [Haloferula rosea]|uniref:Cupin domain-containing protein n=1 Tax=Haloferula rosea TaxID=490093 RepID=A0A934VGX7_9BACT|nr:cupin domain-containing protein [Haloferula rosea]MBK1828050.1 cupin domain-containing protein [Haloferula rosea]